MVVAEMRKTLDRAERRKIFEKWTKLPGVTHERVQHLWATQQQAKQRS